MNDQSRNFFRWLLPSLIIAVASFIYFYRIGDKPLDFDERYSVNIALGTGGSVDQYSSFGQFSSVPLPGPVFHANEYVSRQCVSNMVSAAMNDNGQGIPFFFMLHFWLEFFGVTAVSARCLSALLTVFSLLLLYLFFCRLELNRKVALFVITAFAGNGVLIGLAQYVRFYSLGILLCILSLHLLLSIKNLKRNSSSIPKLNLLFLLLGLLWAIFFLNQYLSALIILPEFIFLAFLFKPKLTVVQFSFIAIAALLPILIWMLPLNGWESLRNIYQLHEHGRLVPAALSTPTTVLNLVIALCSSLAGAFGQPVSFLHGNWFAFIAILPALPAFLLVIFLLKKSLQNDWLKLCTGVLISYSLASILHSILTGHTLLFQVRYWVFGYVFSALFLAYTWPVWKEAGRLIKGLCLLVIFFSFARIAYTSASSISGLVLTARAEIKPQTMPWLEDYEAVAKEIIDSASLQDTVSFKNWKTAQVVNWYLTQHPELTQRVDTTQSAIVMLCRGSEKQDTVAIPRGYALAARAVWMH